MSRTSQDEPGLLAVRAGITPGPAPQSTLSDGRLAVLLIE